MRAAELARRAAGDGWRARRMQLQGRRWSRRMPDPSSMIRVQLRLGAAETLQLCRPNLPLTGRWLLLQRDPGVRIWANANVCIETQRVCAGGLQTKIWWLVFLKERGSTTSRTRGAP